MLFFLTAICFTFCTQHPVYVALTCIMAGAYLVYLRGVRPFLRSLGMFIPMVLFVGILNSLFNSAGATSLWKWGPFSVTVEGMCYGLAVGGMLAAILLWFSCYNEVMTEDKFTYLFGRKLPTISLMVSMISVAIVNVQKRIPSEVVAAQSEYFRSCTSSRTLSQTEFPNGHQGEKQDQRQINREKFDEEAADARMLRMRIELHTDQAGETRDRCAEPADVDTQQKRVGRRSKTGEQERGGHIADDLTREKRSEVFPA